MSVGTTRPNATVANTSQTEPSGTPVWDVLSDNTDTSYARLSEGEAFTVQFAEPSLAAGAKVITGRLWVRWKRPSSGAGVRTTWTLLDPSNASNMWGRTSVAAPGVSPVKTAVVEDIETGPHVTPTDIRASVDAPPTTATVGVYIYELYFDTVYAIKPTVNITAPTGTITGDTTPPVTWTRALDEGGSFPQTHFQAKTSTSSNPASAAIEDSGITAGAALEWQPMTDISDGTRYSHVRVAQTINGEQHWSDYDTQVFTVAISRPGVPTLTLTAQSANGRIQIGLDDNAGAATTDLFETQVSNDGTTWVPLRTHHTLGEGLSTPAGGLATVYDYEASNGVLRHVRTRALHSYPEGYATSAWSATSTATWTGTDWWVKNLLTPSLNVTVLPRSQPSTTRTGRVGLFQPLEAKYPVAVLDKRSSASGQIAFRFQTDVARDAFEALCDETSVVLIQAPAGVIDWPDRYCALGDYERERAIDSSTGAYTFDTVGWTEVARP